MTKTTKSKRQSYPHEFKAEVVRLCETGEKSVATIAKELNLGVSTVHYWMTESKKQKESPSNSALTAAEQSELVALRKELKASRKECEILRSAVSIFAKGVTS